LRPPFVVWASAEVEAMRFGNAKELGQRTIVLARFANPVAAEAGREALEAILESAALEVEELFARRDGEADAAEVAAIYARHGLGDTIGWELEPPVASSGSDLAWTLPPGADADDAEQLIRQLGAQNVAIQETEGDDEEWRAVPHPMILPLPGEELDPFDSDDDDPPTDSDPSRTIH
jgi:hypothetical protein